MHAVLLTSFDVQLLYLTWWPLWKAGKIYGSNLLPTRMGTSVGKFLCVICIQTVWCTATEFGMTTHHVGEDFW